MPTLSPISPTDIAGAFQSSHASPSPDDIVAAFKQPQTLNQPAPLVNGIPAPNPSRLAANETAMQAGMAQNRASTQNPLVEGLKSIPGSISDMVSSIPEVAAKGFLAINPDTVIQSTLNGATLPITPGVRAQARQDVRSALGSGEPGQIGYDALTAAGIAAGTVAPGVDPTVHGAVLAALKAGGQTAAVEYHHDPQGFVAGAIANFAPFALSGLGHVAQLAKAAEYVKANDALTEHASAMAGSESADVPQRPPQAGKVAPESPVNVAPNTEPISPTNIAVNEHGSQATPNEPPANINAVNNNEVVGQHTPIIPTSPVHDYIRANPGATAEQVAKATGAPMDVVQGTMTAPAIQDRASYSAALQQHFGYDKSTADDTSAITDALAKADMKQYPDKYPTEASWYAQHAKPVGSDVAPQENPQVVPTSEPVGNPILTMAQGGAIADIPKLSPKSNSWTVIDKSTSKPVAEVFNPKSLNGISAGKYAIVDSYDYAINRANNVKTSGGIEPPDKPFNPTDYPNRGILNTPATKVNLPKDFSDAGINASVHPLVGGGFQVREDTTGSPINHIGDTFTTKKAAIEDATTRLKGIGVEATTKAIQSRQAPKQSTLNQPIGTPSDNAASLSPVHTDIPGSRIYRALSGHDASTALHEISHDMVLNLQGDDRATVEKYFGKKIEDFSTARDGEHEKLANWWERYFHDGKSPVPQLDGVFARMMQRFRSIYQSIKGTRLDSKIPAEIKQVFDRRLGGGEVHTPTPSEMAESVNLRLFHGDESAKQEVRDAAARLFPNREHPTDDQIREFGKSALHLNYKDIESMRPGVFPAPPDGINPVTWNAAYADQLRNVHAQSKTDLQDAKNAATEARDEHDDNPTEQTQKAVTDTAIKQAEAQRISDLAQVHDAVVAHTSSRTLSIRNNESIPGKGEGYQSALAAAPRMRDEVPVSTPASRANSTRRVPSKFRTVSRDDAKAAAQRIKDRGGVTALHQVAAPARETDVLHQSVDRDETTRDLVENGRFHYEDGIKDFDKWRMAVEGDTGSKLSTSDAQYVYRLVKSDIAADVADRQKSALKPLFVDRLTSELGAKGSAQFLTDIGAHLRDKLISETPLDQFTPSEHAAIAKAYADNQPLRKKAVTGASATIAKQIAGDMKRAANNPSARNPLDKVLQRRVRGGLSSAAKIRTDLESDHLGKAALGKLTLGEDLTDDEGRRVARAIDTYKRTPARIAPSALTQRISTLIKDARLGRLGYDNPKEAARAQLYANANHKLTGLKQGSPRRAKEQVKADASVAKIDQDLEDVGTHDTQAIADVMMKHSPIEEQNQQWVLGNILSGPDTAEKIVIAHPATVGAEEMRRWLFGDKHESVGGVRAAARAAFLPGSRGLSDAATILRKGSTAAHLEGKSLFRPVDTRIPVESKSLPHRMLLRAHSAYYQVLQTYNTERGLHFEATAEAKSKGLSGNDLDNYVNEVRLHPENHRALVEKAIKFGQEETLTNHNLAAKAISDAAKAGGAPGRIAKNTLLPVLNLPLNSYGRELESRTGLLSNIAAARVYEHFHPDATPAEIAAYSKKVQQRGAIGAGIAGIGALGAYTGFVNAPDTKHGRYVSSVNVPRIGSMKARSYDVPAGNVGAAMDTGAYLGHFIKQRDFSKEAFGNLAKNEASVDVNEIPIIRTATMIGDIASGLQGSGYPGEAQRNLDRAGGGLLNEYSPLSGATRNIAAYQDVAKGGGIRKKDGVLDYERNIIPAPIPGNRMTLPLTRDKYFGGKYSKTPYLQPVFHSVPEESAGERAYEEEENYKMIHPRHKVQE